MDNFIVNVKVMIKSEERKGSYGPGIDELIRYVDQTGSLNKACKKMDMSYSKAWKLVNKTEEMLGFDLINRQAGSKGSSLTEKGKELLAYYDELNEAVNKAVKNIEDKYK